MTPPPAAPLATEPRWPVLYLALDGAPPVAFDPNDPPPARRSRVTRAVVAILDGAEGAAIEDALDSLLSPKGWADTIRGTP